MTLTSVPPTAQTQTMLKALQRAVANTLEQKRKLGHYCVIWRNGKPVQWGGEAPVSAAPPRVADDMGLQTGGRPAAPPGLGGD